MLPKSISKAEKSMVLVCVFAILPMVAIVYVAGRRDADPKWNIAPAAPRPIPNGYDSYMAAAMATWRFRPEVDPASDTTVSLPNSSYALKNYSLSRRLAWLKANTRTFALIDKGLSTPSMSPAYEQIRSSGNWSRLRQLARDMSARTRTFQMAHQPMRATMSALDTMQMGQDVTRGGGLLARLVGIAIEAIGRAPLDDWNKTINSLGANEARKAARRLETIIAHDQTPLQTQTFSKREHLLDLRQLFADARWRNILSNSSTGTGQSPAPRAAYVWETQTISKQKIYDNMNRALDTQIANSTLPYSKLKNASLPPGMDSFTQYLALTFSRVGLNEVRHTNSNAILLLRLALQAYIADHGQAPPTLTALAPIYLKTIPNDVYNDGKPLFYIAQGKKYKLWSVGPDGVNDGGVPLSRRPGEKPILPVSNMLDNKGDFVAGLCR